MAAAGIGATASNPHQFPTASCFRASVTSISQRSKSLKKRVTATAVTATVAVAVTATVAVVLAVGSKSDFTYLYADDSNFHPRVAAGLMMLDRGCSATAQRSLESTTSCGEPI